MNKLLVVADNAEEYAKHLRERKLPALDLSVATSMAEAEAFLSESNLILGKPAWVTPLLAHAPKLQWVQSAFAGIEPFCAAGLRKDYTLTGVKGIFGPLMREYVFTYLLALERRLFEVQENQQQHNWQPLPYRRLNGLTMGICGLGSIGQEIAKTANHFGMRVLGLSRSATAVAGVEKVYPPEQISTLAEQVDYLVVVLPNTPATEGLIDQTVLEALGPKGTLINVGRGNAINEQALLNALQQQQIRAAVLDVFESEPLPKEHPLWGFDNVIVTPHHSAVTFPADIANIFCENYRRFLAGEPLNFVIDFQRGY